MSPVLDAKKQELDKKYINDAAIIVADTTEFKSLENK